jgi:4-hydroxy-3-methylbut-2-enyl diphosphate reductase
MNVLLAQPRGFCAGVVRAIEVVEQALTKHGPPVYVLHEIVHNSRVVSDLRERGAVFVERLDEIPPGEVAIFSAHGVAASVVEEAQRRGLRAIDATCPLVSKVHGQAIRYSEEGYEVIVIGHAGHPEVEGTCGRIAGPVRVLCKVEEVEALEVAQPDRLAYVTQTTLSIDDTRDVIEALHRRFPAIQGPDLNDICYATQNRQNAVRWMAAHVDLLLVVGARNSSNSNRLREVAAQAGRTAYLIQGAEEIDPAWLADGPRIGITAGASAPEVVVQEVLARLRELGIETVTEMAGERETVTFRLPDELLRSIAS